MTLAEKIIAFIIENGIGKQTIALNNPTKNVVGLYKYSNKLRCLTKDQMDSPFIDLDPQEQEQIVELIINNQFKITNTL